MTFTNNRLNNFLERFDHVDIEQKYCNYEVDVLCNCPECIINLTIEDTPEFSKIHDIKFSSVKINNTNESQQFISIIKSLQEFI